MSAFSRYLSDNRTPSAAVLDPFCGVGTTLIEALRCGHDAVGFEINPYAALAARAKCEAAAISPLQVSHYIVKFEEHMRASEPRVIRSRHRSTFGRAPFFGPRVEVKVLKALRFINRLRVPPVRELFELAFGSVMVSLSNYSWSRVLALVRRQANRRKTMHPSPSPWSRSFWR